MKTAQKLGYQGEIFVARAFRAYGFDAKQIPMGLDYDVCVENTVKVEVKTSRQNKDGRYNFTLYKNGHADHTHTDYVILLCVVPKGKMQIYVIPTNAVLSVNKISFRNPETYKGKYAKYRVNLA